MPRITYNDVSFEVPEGWEDRSIVSLLAPAPEALSMLRVQKQTSERPSVVMTRSSATGIQFSLADYAAGQERILSEIMEEVEVLDRGTLLLQGLSDENGNPLEAATREFSFKGPEGGVLRQAHAYLRVGDTMLTLTATGSHDASFAEVREQFLVLVRSLGGVSRSKATSTPP